MRLDETQRTVNVSVTALDENGDLDTSFSGEVGVYVSYLGGITPDVGKPPLDTIQLSAGESDNAAISLPPVFGPVLLWVEDSEGGTYATGTSATLWYRDPWVSDISTPTNLESLDALREQLTTSGIRDRLAHPEPN